MNNRMIDLVRQVSDLVDAYGYDAVNSTLQFVNTFPNKSYTRIGDWHTGTYVTITNEQFNQVRDAYRGNGGQTNKISAIKLLRDMTNIGLKEAKDIVENTIW